MKRNEKLLLSLMLSSTVMISSTAMADINNVEGFYAGIQAGWGTTHLSTSDFSPAVAPNPAIPANSPATTVDPKGLDFGFLAGYQINPWAAIEASWIRLSNTEVQNFVIPGTTPTGSGNPINVNIHDKVTDLVGKFNMYLSEDGTPAANTLGLVGRLGVAYVDQSVTNNYVLLTAPDLSKNVYRPITGIGLVYNIDKSLGVEAIYNRIWHGGHLIEDVDYANLALVYSF